MQRETIEYRGRLFHRYPDSPHRHLRVYFWNHSESKKPPVALHRQMWIDAHGPIPKGFIVHHKDNDQLHNELDNFELLSSSAHSRMHGRQPERADQARRDVVRHAMPKAREWHGSAEGREWHRENGRACWSEAQRSKMLRTKKCESCGEDFETYRNFGRFCSGRCGQRAAAKERRYWTDKRLCAYCGNEFLANRLTKTRFCGKRCSALGWRRKAA